MKIKYETDPLGRPVTYCPNKVEHNGYIIIVRSMKCMVNCKYFGYNTKRGEIECFYDINNQIESESKNG